MTNIIRAKIKYCRTTDSNILATKKFKNATPPGQHGNRKRKPTEYCRMIRETKKLRYFYQVKLRALKALYEEACKSKTNKVDKLIELLELRLCTVIFRAKWAPSIFAARQIVSHGFISVNGRRVDIKSYRLKIGDKITLKNSLRENHHLLKALSCPDRDTPPFINCENKFELEVLSIPVMREELFPCKMDAQKVIEYLSL